MSESDAWRDYGGFGGVLAEARALGESLTLPRGDCPKCAYPLSQNAAGEVDCPLGHYSKEHRPTRGEGA
jgi:uncharacterized Zn finger protein (UPF0148 family)